MLSRVPLVNEFPRRDVDGLDPAVKHPAVQRSVHGGEVHDHGFPIDNRRDIVQDVELNRTLAAGICKCDRGEHTS